MRRLVVLFTLLTLSYQSVKSQELNCVVTVNFDQIPGSNRSVFLTLEKSIKEFINQKKWTKKEVRAQERISCAMNIIVTKWENDNFEASLQVQSTRPIFNTTYESPLLNLRDDSFNFTYKEFDQLIYNPTRFDSNLISTLAFYAYIILGVDADSFKIRGGDKYLKDAENVMLLAQNSGVAAWTNQVGKINRFLLIENLLSLKLKAYRVAMYNYHRKGLDVFHVNKTLAKETIEKSIIDLEKLFNKTIANYPIRLFLDAKANEIVNLYSDGPKTRSFQRMLAVLKKISPSNASIWRKIR